MATYLRGIKFIEAMKSADVYMVEPANEEPPSKSLLSPGLSQARRCGAFHWLPPSSGDFKDCLYWLCVHLYVCSNAGGGDMRHLSYGRMGSHNSVRSW